MLSYDRRGLEEEKEEAKDYSIYWIVALVTIALLVVGAL